MGLCYITVMYARQSIPPEHRVFDMVLFNDLMDFPVPSKTAGAYRIASHMRQQGYSVKVIDHFDHFLTHRPRDFFRLVERYVSADTLLIGISTTWLRLTHARQHRSFELFLRHIRQRYPRARVVLGGNTHNSRQIFDRHQHLVDHWVTGMGETAMLALCDGIRSGAHNFDKVISMDPLATQFDFHDSPPMYHSDDDILEGETLPLELSRGCRFRCKFCAYPLLGRNPHEHRYIRSDVSISRELEHNFTHFRTRNYFMVCDTFNETTDKLLTVKRCADDVGVQLNFSAYIRLDLLEAHPEQMDILRELGIRSAFFGLESLHDPSAKSIGKGMGRERVIECLHAVRRSWGEQVVLHGNFIFGLPHENRHTVGEWVALLMDGRLPLDSFRIDPLHIMMDRLTHSSEFERDAKKYGYTMGENNEWTNQHWNKSEASELARHYMDLADSRGIRGVNSWTAMALRNFGWSSERIKAMRYNDLMGNPEVEAAKQDYLDRYLAKAMR